MIDNVFGKLLTIDGAQGEGGGQILRTCLSLSMCLGRPFEITNIRAARSRPGLQPQHLAAVRAAMSVCSAQVEGAERGSGTLRFSPEPVKPGRYNFSIGTAGSTMLVLQTVLPALVLADAPSVLRLEGGTHNPFAPPYEFLAYSYLPLLERMGPTVRTRVERAGFAPKGGGIIHVEIDPVEHLRPLRILERGRILRQNAEVLIAHLPEHIAQRELKVIQEKEGYTADQLKVREMSDAYGPGNAVLVTVESEYVTEVFAAFGARGVKAENVAQMVVDELRAYMNSGVPVGKHLADQLLIPMALAGEGVFVTQKPTSHLMTNIEVIQAFMDIPIRLEEIVRGQWMVSIGQQQNEALKKGR